MEINCNKSSYYKSVLENQKQKNIELKQKMEKLQTIINFQKQILKEEVEYIKLRAKYVKMQHDIKCNETYITMKRKNIDVNGLPYTTNIIQQELIEK